MSEERPDDIVVTGVPVDSPDPLNPDHLQAEAEGDLTKDGSMVKITVKLGDALLCLAYDEDSQESATHAAILLAGAGQLVAEIEEAYAAEEEQS